MGINVSKEEDGSTEIIIKEYKRKDVVYEAIKNSTLKAVHWKFVPPAFYHDKLFQNYVCDYISKEMDDFGKIRTDSIDTDFNERDRMLREFTRSYLFIPPAMFKNQDFFIKFLYKFGQNKEYNTINTDAPTICYRQYFCEVFSVAGHMLLHGGFLLGNPQCKEACSLFRKSAVTLIAFFEAFPFNKKKIFSDKYFDPKTIEEAQNDPYVKKLSCIVDKTITNVKIICDDCLLYIKEHPGMYRFLDNFHFLSNLKKNDIKGYQDFICRLYIANRNILELMDKKTQEKLKPIISTGKLQKSLFASLEKPLSTTENYPEKSDESDEHKVGKKDKKHDSHKDESSSCHTNGIVEFNWK
jgi:hypothetical protein